MPRSTTTRYLSAGIAAMVLAACHGPSNDNAGTTGGTGAGPANGTSSTGFSPDTTMTGTGGMHSDSMHMGTDTISH